MKKRTFIILIIVLLVIVGGIYLFSSKKKGDSFYWKTAPIEQGDIIVNVTATGTISADTTVQVGTQVTGTIAKIYVDFNSVVKKGQIIALLDTTFLAASKEDAAATVDKAVAQVNQSKISFERTQKLLQEKVAAQADYDSDLTNYETSKSALRSALAELNRAKINLDYATIRAPISGVVIARNVDVGQTVISSFNTVTLFSIANDLTKMQVQANVDEADIGQVKVGQLVNFTVDAYPDLLFKGTVQQIRLQPTIVQNVVNYIVIIDVPNPDLKLLPGLTANINIKVQEHQHILKVPANALHFTPPDNYFTQPELPDSIIDWKRRMSVPKKPLGIIPDTSHLGYIWLKKDDLIYPKQIKTGLTDGTSIEVGGAINAGDEVVFGILQEKPAAEATKNPFMPKFPSRGKK